MLAAVTYAKYVRCMAPAILHSDNAKEYLSAATIDGARMNENKTTNTIPHNPDQKGVAERSNMTVMNGLCAVLNTDNMEMAYWQHAAILVVSKQNVMENCTMEQLPFMHGWAK